ncbi:hypothetical protein cypCar_00022165 [Cyprinus carpio]|nr:hypothetical protein cypCar_00022165 [Cyprinus carpio]
MEKHQLESLQDEGSTDRAGVIGWISQGIGKVVPQPDEKHIRDETPESEEVTEVYEAKDLPDQEPLAHIQVVELVSEDEMSEVEPTAQFPPNVMNWIKSGFQNAIPHHVTRPPNSSSSTPRSSQCSNKVYSPPPESITSVTEIELKTPSMVGWIVQGLGLSMPQAMLKNKEGCLEDGKIVQNGELIQERLAMARMAEEVARQTAEMAVRELAQARFAIQTIAEEPEDADQELQVLHEEESDIEVIRNQIAECQVPSVKEFLPEGQEAEAVDTSFTVQTPVEEFKSSSPLQEEPEPEPEPESEELQEEEEPRDSSEAEEEPEPITEQPQSITSTSVSRTDSPVESTAPEEESSGE